MELNLITKAIVNVVIFLEFSDDKIIHPDNAMQALEQLGADLGALSEQSRDQIRRAMYEISNEYEIYGDFVRELPDAMGI